MGFILNGVNVFIKSRVYINKKKKVNVTNFTLLNSIVILTAEVIMYVYYLFKEINKCKIN